MKEPTPNPDGFGFTYYCLICGDPIDPTRRHASACVRGLCGRASCYRQAMKRGARAERKHPTPSTMPHEPRPQRQRRALLTSALLSAADRCNIDEARRIWTETKDFLATLPNPEDQQILLHGIDTGMARRGGNPVVASIGAEVRARYNDVKMRCFYRANYPNGKPDGDLTR